MKNRARLLRKGKKPDLKPSKDWRVRVIVSTHDGFIAWDDVGRLETVPYLADNLVHEILEFKGR